MEKLGEILPAKNLDTLTNLSCPLTHQSFSPTGDSNTVIDLSCPPKYPNYLSTWSDLSAKRKEKDFVRSWKVSSTDQEMEH